MRISLELTMLSQVFLRATRYPFLMNRYLSLKILSSQVVSVMNSLNLIQISESVGDGPLCPDQILVLLSN